ncbi:hypothetical protein NXS19_001809 [Fusarium pseudograminearum]|nr:hypothetical protein NXS19_001809 [Fusarium pseudograminearum]
MSNTYHSVLITDANRTTVVTTKTLEYFVGLTLVTTNTVWPSLQVLTWMTRRGSATVIVNAKNLSAHVSVIPVITVNPRHSVAHIIVRHLTAKTVVKQGCSAPRTLVLN